MGLEEHFKQFGRGRKLPLLQKRLSQLPHHGQRAWIDLERLPVAPLRIGRISLFERRISELSDRLGKPRIEREDVLPEPDSPFRIAEMPVDDAEEIPSGRVAGSGGGDRLGEGEALISQAGRLGRLGCFTVGRERRTTQKIDLRWLDLGRIDV